MKFCASHIQKFSYLGDILFKDFVLSNSSLALDASGIILLQKFNFDDARVYKLLKQFIQVKHLRLDFCEVC